jgi:hypothetical protein
MFPRLSLGNLRLFKQIGNIGIAPEVLSLAHKQ